MMRWKTTVALLAVTVAVGAYVSLYEIRQPTSQERERRSKRLLSLPAQTVTQLAVELPQAKVTLSRSGSGWRMGPQGFRADESLVDQLLTHVSSLMAERTLSGTPQKPLDLKSFGLDPALGQLTFQASGRSTTLRIGETTPVGNNRYASLSGRPDVFIVSSALFDLANQPSEKYRDSLLVRFNTWLADGVTVSMPTGGFSFTRAEDAWRVSLAPGITDQADRAEVNNLLSRLGALAIKRVMDDAPQIEQRFTWGFDTTETELTLAQRDMPTTMVFVGAPLPDDASLRYAKRSDEPSLYAVASADVEALVSDPQRLRKQACVEFFTSEVTKLEVGQGTSPWMIERVDAQWRVAGSDVVLEMSKVAELLNKLSDVRVSGFIDEPASDLVRYGLSPHSGSIVVWTMGNDQPQRLLIGAAVEGSEERYGRIESRNVVVRLPASITELLATTTGQLRPAAPSQPAGSSAVAPTPLHAAPTPPQESPVHSSR
jgi:hypothetical protein